MLTSARALFAPAFTIPAASGSGASSGVTTERMSASRARGASADFIAARNGCSRGSSASLWKTTTNAVSVEWPRTCSTSRCVLSASPSPKLPPVSLPPRRTIPIAATRNIVDAASVHQRRL
jgi:hypothetical protein